TRAPVVGGLLIRKSTCAWIEPEAGMLAVPKKSTIRELESDPKSCNPVRVVATPARSLKVTVTSQELPFESGVPLYTGSGVTVGTTAEAPFGTVTVTCVDPEEPFRRLLPP